MQETYQFHLEIGCTFSRSFRGWVTRWFGGFFIGQLNSKPNQQGFRLTPADLPRAFGNKKDFGIKCLRIFNSFKKLKIRIKKTKTFSEV
jgi:hypothetical protein